MADLSILLYLETLEHFMDEGTDSEHLCSLAVASYDELYGKMRQHRMLREELREKKKELEFMMKKDRPRKQYFRNQDNQSDNISFSNKSDPFG